MRGPPVFSRKVHGAGRRSDTGREYVRTGREGPDMKGYSYHVESDGPRSKQKYVPFVLLGAVFDA